MDVVYFYGGWWPLVRILVVGTLAYVSLVILLRISGARALSQLNAFDFIITIALGASFGRLLTARTVALAEALTVFALLVGLQALIAWWRARSTRFTRIVSSPPVLLYLRGEFFDDRLEATRLRRGALEAALRQRGLGTFDAVEAIVLETDGTFSIIESDKSGDLEALGEVLLEEASKSSR